MNGKDIILNLISSGAYGQVKKVNAKYENIFSEYEECNGTHEEHLRELGEALRRLAEEKKSALLEAKKNKEIANRLNIEERDMTEKEITATDYGLTQINEAMSSGEVALSTIPALLAGGGVVFVVWSVAVKFGKVMGTSIAALAGAVRVNAILLWLGGAVLPGHVGNMAIGMLVVAVAFWIPLLVVATALFRFFAVRKIKKTDEAIVQIGTVISEIKEDLPRLESLQKQVEDMIQGVKASKQLFLDWHEVCCMTDTQRKEKLMALAASMLKTLHTPLEQRTSIIAPEIPPLPAEP